MRIAFTTLGCKINQYETDALREDLNSTGNTIVPFDEAAEVYVINTCSVTAKSDYQCRQMIRSAIRRGNGARIVVTGCYAETRPEELKSIPGVSLVVGNTGKASLPRMIMQWASRTVDKKPEKVIRAIQRRGSSVRTRGFLKIQDGCDNRCSYCIVPIARGNSRSSPPETVITEFERFVRAGCPEIVLSGIHIGTYGRDLIPATTLTNLLFTLVSKKDRSRIRLSSIEPNEITAEMIDLLGTGICRHMHIPLQSGDDQILSAMHRRYPSGFYLELLDNIAKSVPGVALGADIMVGFPGEGKREFQNTFNIVKQSQLTHLHVFSYSPRPGTSAAGMADQVSEEAKRERSEMLRNLGREKNLDFRKKCLGSIVKVVVEDKRDRDSGLLTGLTDNYIRVLISGAKNSHIGKELKVRIDEVDNEKNLAVII